MSEAEIMGRARLALLADRDNHTPGHDAACMPCLARRQIYQEGLATTSPPGWEDLIIDPPATELEWRQRTGIFG